MVLIPEIVVDLMPWKCADCGHKWQDRKDGRGVFKRGCPACGSKRVFDCNVSLADFVRKTLNAERRTLNSEQRKRRRP
jgi:predicted  nucleic acid-binding Zn-ribbon protein